MNLNLPQCNILFLATIHCDALLTISPQCTMFISAEEVSRQTKNIPMEEDSSLLKSYHKVQISRHSLQSKLCRQDKTRTHKYPICNAIIFYCLKSNQKVTLPNKCYVCQTGLHKLWYPGIRDRSTWGKFGAHGEHGDVFLFSNLGAL